MPAYAFSRFAHGRILVLGQDTGTLAAGCHWSLALDPAVGPPVAPVVVWADGVVSGDQSVPIVVRRGAGRLVRLPADLAPGETLVIEPQGEARRPVCWVEVEAEGGLRVAVEHARRAPDGSPIEIVARSSPPYRLAHSGIRRVVVRAVGPSPVTVQTVRAWRAAGEAGDWTLEAAQAFGLPEEILGDLHRYAPMPGGWHDGLAHEPAARVKPAMPTNGAVRAPFEDPTGWGSGDVPVLDTDLDAELARIAALLNTGPRQWVSRAYGPASADLSGHLQHAARSSWTTASGDPAHLLARAATADPGLSRWLGWTGELGYRNLVPFDPADHPDPDHELWRLLWVAAVPVAPAGSGFVGDDQAWLAQAYAGWLGDRWTSMEEAVTVGGRRVVVLLAACPGVRWDPPDVPAPPTVQVDVAGRWLPDATPPPDADPAGDRWWQELTLSGAAPRGPVSLVRRTPEPVTTHAELPSSGAPVRRVAKLAGYSDLGGRARCLMVDSSIPGHVESIEWAVRVGDWAGRWSELAMVQAQRPDPTPPAPPSLTAGYDPHSGTVGYRLVPPAPGPAGSRPIVTLRLRSRLLPGGSEDLPVTPVQQRDQIALVTAAPVALPGPGQWADVPASAVSIDDRGVVSAEATTMVRVIDPRPPAAPTVSPVLLATGRRAGAQTCELELGWPRASGAAGYRVLEASEAILRARHGLGPARGPRAQRAVELLDLDRSTRDDYATAVGCTIVMPDAAAGVGASVVARIRRPAGQTGVTLFRVIPVSDAPKTLGGNGSGVAAPFAECAPFPVVVPLDEVPPAPRLEVGTPRLVDSPGLGRHAWVPLRVVVTGLDPSVLSLLDAGPPQARILRVTPGQDDPWFWPEVSTLPGPPLDREPASWPEPTTTLLDLAAAGESDLAAGVPRGAWTATTQVRLEVWSSTRLAATVRYPGERMRLPNRVPDDSAEITALPPVALGREGLCSPWGQAGPAATVVVDGGPLPAPGLTLDPASLGAPWTTLTLFGLAVAPDSAPRRVQVEIYGSLDWVHFELLETVEILNHFMTVNLPPDVVRVAAVCVDPLGRRGSHGWA